MSAKLEGKDVGTFAANSTEGYSLYPTSFIHLKNHQFIVSASFVFVYLFVCFCVSVCAHSHKVLFVCSCCNCSSHNKPTVNKQQFWQRLLHSWVEYIGRFTCDGVDGVSCSTSTSRVCRIFLFQFVF